MRVEGFLAASATRSPDKVALTCGERSLTYSALERQSNSLAHALQAHGVSPGDRVVVHLDNSIEAVVAIFGILKAGAVFVVLNPTMKAEKLAFILDDAGAVALIGDARRRAVVSEALARAQSVRLVLWVGGANGGAPVAALSLPFDRAIMREAAAAPATDPSPIDLDLAALVYTSGSTGSAKGVMLTHLNIDTAATSITTYLENTADDVILNVLPLSFDYGLYQVLMAVKTGARLILERSFVYPHEVLGRLVREGATGFPIVPTMAALLLKTDLRRYDLSRLRYITNTGAALPTAHIQALRSAAPHVRLYSMYGLTECKRVAYLPPDQVDARPASVGKPMPNVEVFVADESGALHDSGVGELVVRGANVMQGYWRRPEDTARALRPGLLPGEQILFSGDVFRIDEEGYLYFVARRDDIIKSRGEKVSPREVENVICELPAVVEAVVVGVPDPIMGQAVKAFVSLASGATLSEQEVRRHCAHRLEDFMLPRHIEFLPVLPRTANGKIDRRELEMRIAG